MDEAAKRRLTGAAVLVALVVIFVPMLVEEREPGGLGEPIVVPAPPEFDSRLEPPPPPPAPADVVLPLPAPEPPGGRRVEVLPEPPVTAPEAEPTTPAPPVAPAVPADPKPVPAGTRAWVVQVASVNTRDGADKMQRDLRAKGYTAFVEEAVVNGKTYYRVRVGPEVDRKRADGVAKRIEATTGKKPMVQSYP